MTLKQITYFQTVCAKQNISLAAEELFVARSVVSRAIGELEEEFGAPLFLRSKNGVVLTESGRILAKLFENFTTCYHTAQERIRHQAQGEQAGPLRLGVTPTNAYCVYRTYLEQFQLLHPHIPLYVEEHSAFDAWKLLLDGRLDAFFTPAKPDSPCFQSLDLYQNSVMLGAAAGSPLSAKKSVSIADILDLPLGFYNAPVPIEPTLNACFAAFGKKPNVVLRTSDQLLLRDLTARGKIYTILTLDSMATWEGVQEVPLDFFHPSINRMVWNDALPLSAEMEVFLAHMRRQV